MELRRRVSAQWSGLGKRQCRQRLSANYFEDETEIFTLSDRIVSITTFSSEGAVAAGAAAVACSLQVQSGSSIRHQVRDAPYWAALHLFRTFGVPLDICANTVMCKYF